MIQIAVKRWNKVIHNWWLTLLFFFYFGKLFVFYYLYSEPRSHCSTEMRQTRYLKTIKIFCIPKTVTMVSLSWRSFTRHKIRNKVKQNEKNDYLSSSSCLISFYVLLSYFCCLFLNKTEKRLRFDNMWVCVWMCPNDDTALILSGNFLYFAYIVIIMLKTNKNIIK